MFSALLVSPFYSYSPTNVRTRYESDRSNVTDDAVCVFFSFNFIRNDRVSRTRRRRTSSSTPERPPNYIGGGWGVRVTVADGYYAHVLWSIVISVAVAAAAAVSIHASNRNTNIAAIARPPSLTTIAYHRRLIATATGATWSEDVFALLNACVRVTPFGTYD